MPALDNFRVRSNPEVLTSVFVAAEEMAFSSLSRLVGRYTYPIERHYRDVIALTIYEGTSDIQRVILSRGLLGRDEG